MSKQFWKRTCLPLSLLAILFTVSVVTTQAFADSTLATYDKSTNKLSVNASDMPLSNVMEEISTETGVTIRVDEAADQTVSLEIKERPLEDALKQVVKGYQLNNMFVHTFQDGEPILKEMRILPKGDSSSATPGDKTLFGSTSTNSKSKEALKEERLQRLEERRKLDQKIHEQIQQENLSRSEKDRIQREKMANTSPEEQHRQWVDQQRAKRGAPARPRTPRAEDQFQQENQETVRNNASPDNSPERTKPKQITSWQKLRPIQTSVPLDPEGTTELEASSK